MTESKYKFLISISNGEPLNVNLTEGKALFVLGANGVGKSTLMQNLFEQNFNHSKRILAHRQTWFSNNTLNLTAKDKNSNERDMKNRDKKIESRWKDDYSGSRANMTIYDIINSENIRARNITKAVDNDNIELAKNLSNIQAPLEGINELLGISNIPIKIILDENEQLFASKNGSAPYSIAELSDGERNALLICADVLTSEPNQLIILDEPERHLHRSIISPLLTSLFQKRKDCVFVISTHDIYLPIDHKESSVLLLRDCGWNGKKIQDWDADLISETDEIPSNIKQEILGSKRDILFVEGNNGSLDRQIYQLIFPNLTVISQGSCKEVEKAVDGIRGTEGLHWVSAYGLIDADDREPDQIQTLLTKGIAALDSYSVESLYYNTEIIKKVAERYSEVSGKNKEELYASAISKIIDNIIPHKERLCSRLCEKQVRNNTMSNLPKHQDIIERGEFEIKIDLNEFIEREESVFDNLVAQNNINGLISRYPIRETPVINGITSGLGLTSETYESTVRKLIIDKTEVKEFYKNLLKNLTDII
ncbi:AAA family ATPase [Aquimarina addita]|uniref:AAA family ATPase n=2 Tax=Aquimarina addita TaxID=870485 RepID=A0ABP6UXF6_9FLAO